MSSASVALPTREVTQRKMRVTWRLYSSSTARRSPSQARCTSARSAAGFGGVGSSDTGSGSPVTGRDGLDWARTESCCSRRFARSYAGGGVRRFRRWQDMARDSGPAAGEGVRDSGPAGAADPTPRAAYGRPISSRGRYHDTRRCDNGDGGTAFRECLTRICISGKVTYWYAAIARVESRNVTTAGGPRGSPAPVL